MLSRKNGRRIPIRVGLLLVLGLSVACGCGSKKEDSAMPPVQPEGDVEPGARMPPKPPPPRPLAQSVKPKAVSDSDGSGSLPMAKRVQRPKTLSDWTPDHYLAARRENDPKLIAAAAYLGEHSAGKPEAVACLVGLLDATPAGNSEDAPGRTQPTPLKLVEAVAAALAANGTPRAWQALEQLAAGKLPSVDKRLGQSAAVKALLSRPCPETEAVVLRLLTSEQEVSSTVATVRTAPRDSPLVLVKQMASASLRERLAQAMIAEDAPSDMFEQFWTCLDEPRPENLLAQAILYQSDCTDPATKDLLEERFLAQTPVALNRILRITSAKEGRPSLESAIAPTDPRLVAKTLWTGEFTTAVARRLASFDALDKGKRIVLLASTLPCPPVREALARSLKMHWEEDPKAVDTAGALAEPGLLVVLKKLPRKAPSPRRTTTPGAKTPKATALLKAKQEDEKTANRWMQFSEKVLRALCWRLRSAATATTNVDEISVKPHPNAEIVAVYRRDLSSTLGTKASNGPASALRVRYVRIEQLARPSRILAYYRRQLPACQERTTKDDFWLESLAASEAGMLRSVDVLVTRPKDAAAGTIDQEQRVVVELVTVKCAGNATKEDAAKVVNRK